VLGTEIGDTNRPLDRGAGGNNLGEDMPQMVAAERSRVVRDDPLDHLALPRRLIDRRAVGDLEMPDCLRDARTLGQQFDQRQVDFVDPLAQIGQLIRALRGFLGDRSHCGRKG
jgi:hypothetical protein